uniref:Immunoglobulin I-set domain-containing protein n=1 Tax=Meloidogyne floridensis TaxID=298350 RepID=A0A915PBR4_9BILA
MSPPAIQGQPKIRHDEQTNSVFLEVSVLGAEATKTKWYLEEKEIASGTGAYRMSTQEQEGGKKLIICEIKNYDKSMQGTYKAVSIQTGDGEKCHHSGTNFELCKSLDPE